MLKIKIIFALACWWIVNSACSSDLDKVIAIVNDGVITLSEYQSHLNREQLQGLESGEIQAAALDTDILRSMIDERLQVQEAIRSGVPVSESEVDVSVQTVAQQNGVGADELLERLASSGISEEEFRRTMAEQILIQKIVNARVSQNVRVTDQEVEHFIKSYPDLFSTDVSYELSQLRIPITGLEAEQVGARQGYLDAVRTRLLSGTDLEDALADSPYDNIEFEYLGWRPKSLIPDLIVAEIEKTVTENATEIVMGSNALHLFVIHGREGNEMFVTQYRLRQISISPRRKRISDEAALELAQDIVEKINNGEDFSALARLYSDDEDSAVEGGESEWLNPGEIDSPILQAVSDLGINQLSDPIKTLYGYYLIEVIETRTRDIMRDIVRRRAHDMIFDRKAGTLFDSWLGQIRSSAYIEILTE
ncbi:MAG: hypothetical protein F4093_04020 [Gammaproteobacteria bacterium]|nr:hypothetical protein [Gammaproteobacteria bacterium]